MTNTSQNSSFCNFYCKRFAPVTARTLNEKLAKAEKKTQETYFAEGVHSSDPTGAESEDSIPRFARLYDEFFIWKNNNVRTARNGRLDTTFRDTRRIRAQSYIDAQAPLGHQGQELRTEVTQSNRRSMQHLASSSSSVLQSSFQRPNRAFQWAFCRYFWEAHSINNPITLPMLETLDAEFTS
jgi:hypothetical protein